MYAGEAHVLYKIEKWLKGRARDERVFTQVPMGVYMETECEVGDYLFPNRPLLHLLANLQSSFC